jgi:hypothetical protein
VGREDQLAQIAAFATGTDNAFSRDTADRGLPVVDRLAVGGQADSLAEAVQTMPG